MPKPSNSRRVGGSIRGNGENGIFLSLHSIVRLLFGVRVYGNEGDGVTVLQDSGLIVGEDSFVPSNKSGTAVYCGDKESSLAIDPTAIVGVVNCPDPDF